MYETIFEMMTEMFPNKKFVTALEIAKFLDCEIEMIQRWSKKGKPESRPPRLLVGREARYPMAEFCKWLSTQKAREGLWS